MAQRPSEREIASEPAWGSDPGVAWMRAYQAGDERAFERIVATYAAPVHALVARFLGAEHGREDVVQEVFLRVVQNRARYVPSARLSTWLYRIAFNLCAHERERARPQHSLDESAAQRGAFEQLAPAEAAPDSALARADAIGAVRAAIARLPEAQRMALLLARYEELSHAEIAQVLGSSEKAVKSLVHRARERLREELRPWLEEQSA
jgi:RNA polymerase sigma-70 factor (ECF subfamily)